MGMNIQKGLEGLSQGLGALTKHAIYKDEVARRERLEAAQQAFQERQMALQEKAFMAGEERHKESMEFEREKFETESDLKKTEVESTAQYRSDVADAQKAGQRSDDEHRKWQRDQAETAAKTAEEQARLEQYSEREKEARERAYEIHDKIFELESEGMQLLPEQQAALDRYKQQLDTLAADQFRAGIEYGVITEDDFTEQQNQIINWVQDDQNMDRGAAIANMLAMTPDEVQMIAQEIGMDEQAQSEGLGLGGMPSGAQDEFMEGSGPGTAEAPPTDTRDHGSANKPSVGGFLEEKGRGAARAVGKGIGEFASDPLGKTWAGLENYGALVMQRSEMVGRGVFSIWDAIYNPINDAAKAGIDEAVQGYESAR